MRFFETERALRAIAIELTEARRCAGGDGDTTESIDQLAAEHAALGSEAAPWLALAPPAAPPLPDTPWALALVTGAMGIDAGWSKSAKQYLYAKGTGQKDASEVSDADLNAGMHAGAKKILEDEVGALDIKDLPLAQSLKGWGK